MRTYNLDFSDKSTSMEEFAKALKLPGIIDYSFHLFCVKLSKLMINVYD